MTSPMTTTRPGKERVQLSAEELRVLLGLTLETIRDREEITPETVLLGSVLVKLGRALSKASGIAR